MTLPMAIYFHRITVFALPVNMLILPLLLVLMPAALITLIALLVWPAAAVVPGAIVALLLHFGVRLVHVFGSLALGDFRIPAPLAWQSAVFCALLGAAMLLALGQKWQRRTAWVALAAAALVAVLPRPVRASPRCAAGGGDRCRAGRLAAAHHSRRQDAACGWRRIRRGSQAGSAGIRYWRRGGFGGAVVARHPAPGCGGAEPCAFRSHGRLAGGAAQFSSRRTVGGQQSARSRRTTRYCARQPTSYPGAVAALRR